LIYIGIDPAFRKNGFVICIINEQREVDFITFKDFTAFIDWVWTAPLAIYTVENSYLQDLTFDMRGSKPEIAKKSRHVGMNQAISEATFRILKKMFGSYVFEISPKAKGEKWNDNQLRLYSKHFKHTVFLNYKGLISEQDKRDSYKLALFSIDFEKKLKKL
jgi:hypothetical protein